MKKLFSLLAAVCLVGSMWGAAPTALSFKEISKTTLIYPCSVTELSGTNYIQDGKGTKVFSPSSSDYSNCTNPNDEDGDKVTISNGNAVCLKTAETVKSVYLYVTGVNQIDVYGWNNNNSDNRSITITAKPSNGSNLTNTCTAGTGNLKATLSGLTESERYTIILTANNDVYAYAIRLTTSNNDTRSDNDLQITSQNPVTLNPTETSQITYTTSSTGAVTYQSANTNIATVSEDGLITAIAFGTTTITVNSADDANYMEGTETITVNVNKVRKATSVTGQMVINTTNGAVSNGVWTDNINGAFVVEGSFGTGSNNSNDLKDDHYKFSGTYTITLPTNYDVTKVGFIGYRNKAENTLTLTLKSVDG